jgi:ABC-type transport system involved in cytochrome bd biosynthesis fused ATPase/permease subunit
MSLTVFLVLEFLLSGYFSFQSIARDSITGVMAVPFIEAFAEVLYIPVFFSLHLSNISLLWTAVLFVLLPIMPAVSYSVYKYVSNKNEQEQNQKLGGGMYEVQGRQGWESRVRRRDGNPQRKEATDGSVQSCGRVPETSFAVEQREKRRVQGKKDIQVRC